MDGTIVSWAWDFGDGNTSTAQHPSHSYAVPGTYTVSLTVTDDLGATGSTSQTVDAVRPPPLLWIQSVFRNQQLFEFSVQLQWTGADTAFVDLYRNDNLQDIMPNTGNRFDIFRNYAVDYTWYVCEAPQTNFCSNTVGIQFGAGFNGDTVKVVSNINGIETVQEMEIIDVK